MLIVLHGFQIRTVTREQVRLLRVAVHDVSFVFPPLNISHLTNKSNVVFLKYIYHITSLTYVLTLISIAYFTSQDISP